MSDGIVYPVLNGAKIGGAQIICIYNSKQDAIEHVEEVTNNINKVSNVKRENDSFHEYTFSYTNIETGEKEVIYFEPWGVL